MNDTTFIWITNLPCKCKQDDVAQILKCHGDIIEINFINRDRSFNALVEFVDRSSAARAISAQNLLKGYILKLDYCDSKGEPWISRLSRFSTASSHLVTKRKPDHRFETMLVDRPGADPPSSVHQRALSSPIGHHLHYLNMPSTSPSSSDNPLKSWRSPSSSSSQALRVRFSSPSTHSEMQIKQYLNHEFHKFGKTLHVTLLPTMSTNTTSGDLRSAIIVFRHPDDSERAYLAYKNATKTLYGAKVAIELCTSSDANAAQLSLPNRRNRTATTASSPSWTRGNKQIQQPFVTIPSTILPHSSSLNRLSSTSLPSTTTATVSGLQTVLPVATSKPPTRTLIISGLTVGLTGPVSAEQLTTAFKKFGDILDVQMRPSSTSALIEFAELRGAHRAMTAHSRDPLRLGGRPLKLVYTPSRANLCLWLADLPPSLVVLTDTELVAKFSCVALVEKVILINRPDQQQHAAALVRLKSTEAASTLLNFLRSPGSPFMLARSDESCPQRSFPVDFANPRQSSIIDNIQPRTSEYGPPPCRIRVISSLTSCSTTTTNTITSTPSSGTKKTYSFKEDNPSSSKPENGKRLTSIFNNRDRSASEAPRLNNQHPDNQCVKFSRESDTYDDSSSSSLGSSPPPPQNRSVIEGGLSRKFSQKELQFADKKSRAFSRGGLLDRTATSLGGSFLPVSTKLVNSSSSNRHEYCTILSKSVHRKYDKTINNSSRKRSHPSPSISKATQKNYKTKSLSSNCDKKDQKRKDLHHQLSTVDSENLRSYRLFASNSPTSKKDSGSSCISSSSLTDVSCSIKRPAGSAYSRRYLMSNGLINKDLLTVSSSVHPPRLSENEVPLYESMYDKIKRRTKKYVSEEKKYQQSEAQEKKKKKRCRREEVDKCTFKSVNRRSSKSQIDKFDQLHNGNHHLLRSPMSLEHSPLGSHTSSIFSSSEASTKISRSTKLTDSRDSYSAHINSSSSKQKRDAAQPKFPASIGNQHAGTITRLSLGMSVPMTANFHAISSKGQSKLASSHNTSLGDGGSDSSAASEFKSDSCNSRSSHASEVCIDSASRPKLERVSPILNGNEFEKRKLYPEINGSSHAHEQRHLSYKRHFAKDDDFSDSDINYGIRQREKKMKKRHPCAGNTLSTSTILSKSPKNNLTKHNRHKNQSKIEKRARLFSHESPSTMHSQAGWSSSDLNSNDDNRCDHSGIVFNRISKPLVGYQSHKTTKQWKTRTSIVSSSSSDHSDVDSSSGSSSLLSADNGTKFVPWMLPSSLKPLNNPLFENLNTVADDDNDSLDDLDRSWANSHSTPSTEAMESYEDLDESDNKFGDSPSCGSSNSLLCPLSVDGDNHGVSPISLNGNYSPPHHKIIDTNLSRNFEDVTMVNCSKDESMNLSGDAIGEIMRVASPMTVDKITDPCTLKALAASSTPIKEIIEIIDLQPQKLESPYKKEIDEKIKYLPHKPLTTTTETIKTESNISPIILSNEVSVIEALEPFMASQSVIDVKDEIITKSQSHDVIKKPPEALVQSTFSPTVVTAAASSGHILSPSTYSSSSPSQSLCSNCSQSSPSATALISCTPALSPPAPRTGLDAIGNMYTTPIITIMDPVTAVKSPEPIDIATNDQSAIKSTLASPITLLNRASQKSPLANVDDGKPLSENHDMKRYVQSVIERVKAESVEETAAAIFHPSANRLGGAQPTAKWPVTTTIISPGACATVLHVSVSPGSTPIAMTSPLATCGIAVGFNVGKKLSNSKRNIPLVTIPSISSVISPPALRSAPITRSTSAKISPFHSLKPRELSPISLSSLPSIPGVNACAPLTELATASWDPPLTASSQAQTSSVLNSKLELVKPVAPVLPLLGVSLRPRRKSIVQAASSPVTVRDMNTPPPYHTLEETEEGVEGPEADPYEPNFDEDSPPPILNSVVAPHASIATSSVPVLVKPSQFVNTSKLMVSPLSLITSAVSISQAGNSDLSAALETSSKTKQSAALDTVDEVINEVCLGNFDMQSYLDSWCRPTPVSTKASTLTTATTVVQSKTVSKKNVLQASSRLVASAKVKEQIMSPTIISPEKVKVPMGGTASVQGGSNNGNLFTAILNALQMIPGSQVTAVIGGGNGTNNSTASSSGILPTGTSIPGSSANTISATTITLPMNAAVFLNNVILAAGSTRNAVRDQPVNVAVKPTMANSQLSVSTAPNIPTVAVTSVPCSSLHQLPGNEAPRQSDLPDLKLLSPQQQAQLNRTRHGSESGVFTLPIKEKHLPKEPFYEMKQARSRSNSGNYEITPKDTRRQSVPSLIQQQQHTYFGPRGYVSSGQPKPEISPDIIHRNSSAGQGIKGVSNAWSFPHSAVSPRQQSEITPSTYSAVFDKLSRVIDPELVLPFVQAAISLSNSGTLKNLDGGPLSEGDLVNYLMKLVHNFNETPDVNIAQILRWCRTDYSTAARCGILDKSIAQELSVSPNPPDRATAVSTNSTPSPCPDLPSQTSTGTPVSLLCDNAMPTVSTSGSSRSGASPLSFSSTASSVATGNVGLQERLVESSILNDPSSGQYHPKNVPSPSGRSLEQAYPLVWQGRLSLKNSEACVALHFVQGNTALLRSCITVLAVGGGGSPQQALVTTGGPLRIVQRMRLESAQLEAVQRKMTQEGASCACVAFASGASPSDLLQQTRILSDGFIRYMQEKGAAGIINVGHPNSMQGLYVVHIFPPCEFSHNQLRQSAPDLHQRVLQAQMPHLLIVITTV